MQSQITIISSSYISLKTQKFIKILIVDTDVLVRVRGFRPKSTVSTVQTSNCHSDAIPFLPLSVDHPRELAFNPSASRLYPDAYPDTRYPNGQVRVDSRSPEVIGYKIFWGTGSYNYQNARDVRSALSTSLSLSKSDKYYVSVVAYSMTETSWFSNEVVVPRATPR